MKTLVVTGGSRGIGAATALAAARAGWAVIVNYRSAEVAAEAVRAQIVDAGGAAALFKGDVADEAVAIGLFDFAQTTFGPVRGLVNNAGILRPATPFAEIGLERWNAVFAVNTTGAFLCAREAVRRMARSRGGQGGAIVNLSSMAAVLGGAGEFVDYAASKGAIDTLTVGLAKEVAGDGIRVNGVRPGLIDTEMQADSGDPARAARLAGTVPMGRVGTADEVADAIVWLLSDEAGYVTGITLNVSGGR